VIRYKPARRCVIEYDLETTESRSPARAITLVGKVRARGVDRRSYELLQSLWRGQFGPACPDQISVPEPVGVVADFRMTLQRKVTGVTAGEALLASDGAVLAIRIADAAAKIHRAGLPAHRRRTMDDELCILRDRLAAVAAEQPHHATRLTRLLAGCVEVGAALADQAPAGIHRDFYHDQVIVDGPRLYVLDFDLYSEGDPALDIGNFAGHLTELSLRMLGDPAALADRERALEDRYVEHSGERTRHAIRVYAALSLARHIFLSTQFPERRGLTGALIELAEQRLARLRD
jgi:aminoglycoside phosphotransferase (APT) family kinase protein